MEMDTEAHQKKQNGNSSRHDGNKGISSAANANKENNKYQQQARRIHLQQTKNNNKKDQHQAYGKDKPFVVRSYAVIPPLLLIVSSRTRYSTQPCNDTVWCVLL
eukprot:TRINITY_DN12837_c1_g2_i2.p5 TRINITY_DN12837_c1_g2~~TRINITY_DN12837_c1_g2_i2.p5  ORF type:complete len:104 (-),score=13.22 TRINITY_DN12837_c1_g2_i2:100-411(-)